MGKNKTYVGIQRMISRLTINGMIFIENAHGEKIKKTNVQNRLKCMV